MDNSTKEPSHWNANVNKHAQPYSIHTGWYLINLERTNSCRIRRLSLCYKAQFPHYISKERL